MNKIDPVQLEKDIKDIPNICNEGVKAIKRLFSNNFGVDFTPEVVLPKAGEVWDGSCNPKETRYHHLITKNCKGLYVCDANQDAIRLSQDYGSWGQVNLIRKIANNLEEYYYNKFNCERKSQARRAI